MAAVRVDGAKKRPGRAEARRGRAEVHFNGVKRLRPWPPSDLMAHKRDDDDADDDDDVWGHGRSRFAHPEHNFFAPSTPSGAMAAVVLRRRSALLRDRGYICAAGAHFLLHQLRLGPWSQSFCAVGAQFCDVMAHKRDDDDAQET
jgi:hypothetical protein